MISGSKTNLTTPASTYLHPSSPRLHRYARSTNFTVVLPDARLLIPGTDTFVIVVDSTSVGSCSVSDATPSTLVSSIAAGTVLYCHLLRNDTLAGTWKIQQATLNSKGSLSSNRSSVPSDNPEATHPSYTPACVAPQIPITIVAKPSKIRNVWNSSTWPFGSTVDGHSLTYIPGPTDDPALIRQVGPNSFLYEKSGSFNTSRITFIEMRPNIVVPSTFVLTSIRLQMAMSSGPSSGAHSATLGAYLVFGESGLTYFGGDYLDNGGTGWQTINRDITWSKVSDPTTWDLISDSHPSEAVVPSTSFTFGTGLADIINGSIKTGYYFGIIMVSHISWVGTSVSKQQLSNISATLEGYAT